MATKYLLLFILYFYQYGVYGQRILKKEDVAVNFFLDSLLVKELKKHKSLFLNPIISNSYSEFILYPDCFKHKSMYAEIKSAIILLNKDSLKNKETLLITHGKNNKIKFKKYKNNKKIKPLCFFIEVNRAVFVNSNYYVSIDTVSRGYLRQYFFEVSNTNQILTWCKQELIF